MSFDPPSHVRIHVRIHVVSLRLLLPSFVSDLLSSPPPLLLPFLLLLVPSISSSLPPALPDVLASFLLVLSSSLFTLSSPAISSFVAVRSPPFPLFLLLPSLPFSLPPCRYHFLLPHSTSLLVYLPPPTCVSSLLLVQFLILPRPHVYLSRARLLHSLLVPLVLATSRSCRRSLSSLSPPLVVVLPSFSLVPLPSP
ncbi:hypothetical protein B0H11DRAFT_2283359 [Mycena galericulata]|nr:hypothetical protein B0H11DRAFT_2283359 [Mycena galericulata]